MSSFTELLADVYTMTKRTDLVAETKLAVKTATLKAHMTDFYSKDIYEAHIHTNSADYIQGIDYVSIISNFRALKYLRKFNATTRAVGAFIQVITPDEVLDTYGTTRSDVCYVAGRVLEIKSSTQESDFLLGCYVTPIVTESKYSSWIADLYPNVIVMEAVRMIFKIIGYDEQAAVFERLVAEQYALLKTNALPDVGY